MRFAITSVFDNSNQSVIIKCHMDNSSKEYILLQRLIKIRPLQTYLAIIKKSTRQDRHPLILVYCGLRSKITTHISSNEYISIKLFTSLIFL